METISVPCLPLPSPASFTPLQLCGPGHFLVTIVQANLHLRVYFSQSWEPESGGRGEKGTLFNTYFFCVWILLSEYVLHVLISKRPI